MKTIKKIINGKTQLKRVSDREAIKMVDELGWKYTNKKEWKALNTVTTTNNDIKDKKAKRAKKRKDKFNR